jgi:UDP-N-acetylmuramyl pentapeptide phosphotransferase/UDP-N-acetylglucosamine-1-phosphate transferase
VTGLPISARAGLSLAAVLGAFAAGGGLAVSAALATAVLTIAAMPLFRRYAMARPNARSSHHTPVPQGGGAAIVLSTLALATFAAAGAGGMQLGFIAMGVLLLAIVGTIDDIRSLPVLPRLGLQFIAVISVVLGAFGTGRILPEIPMPVEIAVLVNLTNFIDGIDGITLAGFMPLAAAGAALSWMGFTTPVGGWLATVFLGALAGFVWFNLPRARLFLGDVGSLPLGLIGVALLIDIAQQGALAAAVILPLYGAADATSTLFGRMLRREKVWEAHRQHAYQRAVDGGWSHARVSGLVLGLNCGLAGLALLSTRLEPGGQAACVAAAAMAVVGLIGLFRSRKQPG